MDRDKFLRHGQRLWDHEEETIKDCQGLKSQVPSEEESLVDALLVDALLDVMIFDSQKHQRLL